MTTLTIDKKNLVDAIEQAAQSQNLSADEVLDKAVAEYIDRWASQKLRSEQDAFAQLYPQLVEQHFGQYVAIHNGCLIDSDSNDRTLHLRLRQKYGQMPILLRKVTDDVNPPTFLWRRPRLEQILP